MKTHQIDSKMRTHIARNIRITEELYGFRAAQEFAFDAIEFCLSHDRDVEFACILERSHARLLAVPPATGHAAWKRELAERLIPMRVESNSVIAFTPKPQPAPVTNWQGFGW